MGHRPTDSDTGDSADDGVIGEIAGAETDQPASEETSEGGSLSRWRRRRIIIGCLLAVLGAFLGGAAAVLVGRGQAERPADEEVVTAEGIPLNRLTFSPTPERPRETPDIIAAETEFIYCFYELGGVPRDAQLAAQWSHDGEELGEVELHNHQRDAEVDHARGRFELRHPPEDGRIGFRSGVYELELSAVEFPEVVAVASFVVLPRAARILQGGGDPEGPPVIRSLRTAHDVSDEGEPIGAATSFRPDVGRIYAVFEYEGIMPGAVVTARWHYAATEIERARSEISIPSPRGTARTWLATGRSDLLPPGSYRVAIHLGDEEEALASVGFTVDESAPRN